MLDKLFDKEQLKEINIQLPFIAAAVNIQFDELLSEEKVNEVIDDISTDEELLETVIKFFNLLTPEAKQGIETTIKSYYKMYENAIAKFQSEGQGDE